MELGPCGRVRAPRGKVASITQGQEISHDFIAKRTSDNRLQAGETFIVLFVG